MPNPSSHRRHGTVRDAFRILVLAFLLNWIWEATHAVAYVESTGSFLYRLRHCLPMAATDALWTLAIWVAATATWCRTDRRALRVATVGVLGALTAIVVERAALADGRWSYNTFMPIIPIVGVGLWPVAQMVVLPVITVWLVRARRTHPPASGPTDRLA